MNPHTEPTTLQSATPLPPSTLVGFTGQAMIQAPQTNTPASGNGSIGAPAAPSTNSITDEEQSKLQLLWNGEMRKQMKVPNGYCNVAVLMVKWKDHLGDHGTRTQEEVDELGKVFKNKFGYETRVVDLHNKQKPQLQLNSAVAKFVEEFSGPHTLLIFYYTGHACYIEEEEILQLHAASAGSGDVPEGEYPVKADYQAAESHLIEADECDILAIFDACFASNICKSGELSDRTFELFAASGQGKIAAGPGPRSFTTALINALNDLLEHNGGKPFTTRQLCETINLSSTRHKRHDSHVWSRFKKYHRSLELAPLKRTSAERKEQFHEIKTRSRLTLQLPLTVERLSEQQIIDMARALSKAVRDMSAPVKSIEWAGLLSAGRPMTMATVEKVIRFKKKLQKAVAQGKRWASSPDADNSVPRMIESETQTVDSSPSPLTKRKRKRNHEGIERDADDEDGSDRSTSDSHRRRESSTGQVPLTPTSGAGIESG